MAQDLAPGYPVAKISKSTNAKSVIPVLRDIYDLFGNPLRQKSDNVPPFNFNEMAKFGKAMKIGNMQNLPEQETLIAFLISYRDTPHVSTGVPSAHMLFWDGCRNNLSHHKTSDDKIGEARQTDRDIKKERNSTYNSSRHTADVNYKIGDQVLLRNYQKESKFDLYYLPE